MKFELRVKYILHKDLDQAYLDMIIALKQEHWHYPYESQYMWIEQNLNQDDIHILILNSKEILIGYLNLIDMKIFGVDFYGIGNVCILPEMIGTGLGVFLINSSQYFAKKTSRKLILLCKDHLVAFYEKCNFFRYKKPVYISNELTTNNVMLNTHCFDDLNELSISKNF